jgi:hypothetical protein
MMMTSIRTHRLARPRTLAFSRRRPGFESPWEYQFFKKSLEAMIEAFFFAYYRSLKMKSYLFLIFFISHSAWSLTTTDTLKVKELVTETIIKNQEIENTGVSVSVFNKKEIIFQSGFGHANMDEKTPCNHKNSFCYWLDN